MKKLKFRMFITGESTISNKAKKQVEKLIEVISSNTEIVTELEVVDIMKQKVKDEKWLIVTPMLVKYFPEPEKRVFGDFSDIEKTLNLLGLSELNIE